MKTTKEILAASLAAMQLPSGLRKRFDEKLKTCETFAERTSAELDSESTPGEHRRNLLAKTRLMSAKSAVEVVQQSWEGIHGGLTALRHAAFILDDRAEVYEHAKKEGKPGSDAHSKWRGHERGTYDILWELEDYIASRERAEQVEPDFNKFLGV